jgi:hypothetical protein
MRGHNYSIIYHVTSWAARSASEPKRKLNEKSVRFSKTLHARVIIKRYSFQKCVIYTL